MPGDNSLLMFKFTPEKKLAGFDDYYAFVTPKTRKLVKVCACAKNPVESNPSGRRHYLVEALENKLLFFKKQKGVTKSQTMISLTEHKLAPSYLPDEEE